MRVRMTERVFGPGPTPASRAVLAVPGDEIEQSVIDDWEADADVSLGKAEAEPAIKAPAKTARATKSS